MLSFVNCRFPQQRRRDPKNCIFLSVIAIFLVAPHLPTAHEDVQKFHEFPSHSTASLDALSSSPTGLFSLLEDFDHNDSPKLHQVTHQDPEASRSKQSFLRKLKFPATSDKIRNHGEFTHSQPPISIDGHNNHLRSFTYAHHYANHPVRPQVGHMLSGAQVSYLTKRDQVDFPSTTAQYFPQPFDTSLGTEFESDTCQPFMSKFLNNPSFQDCHAFSLLLTTSDAFFRAYSALNSNSGVRETSALPVKQVLDAACRADVNKCAALLDELAVDINSAAIGCGKDLEKQNSLPLQALEGLKNYKLMREVACLTTSNSGEFGVQNGTSYRGNSTFAHGSSNNSTIDSPPFSTRYCFEKAVSSHRPDDQYYYYLPLGTSLPSGTQSSCDQCIRSIMKLYSINAFNNSLALSKTYLSARTMTNSECGPGFAPLPINMGHRFASTAHRCSRLPLSSSLKFATWTFIILNSSLSLVF